LRWAHDWWRNLSWDHLILVLILLHFNRWLPEHSILDLRMAYLGLLSTCWRQSFFPRVLGLSSQLFLSFELVLLGQFSI
jgi:hypothetical protein